MIMFILPSLGKGGAQRATVAIMNSYAKLDCDVVAVILKSDTVKYPLASSIKEINLNISSFSKALPSLVKIFYRYRPQSVYSCLWHINMITYLATLFCPWKINFVQSIHNNPAWIMKTENRYLSAFYYHFLTRFQKKIIVVSRGIERYLLERAKVSPHKIKMIYNPAITNNHALDLEIDLNNEFVNKNSGKYLLWVGRLDYQKDIDFLLDVYDQLPLPILIIGDGPDQNKVQKVAAKSAGRIQFLPFQSNIMYFMKHAFCLVLTSRFEGFGLVLVESLYAGVPVISTNCDYGPSEIIENNVNGFLVNSQSEMVDKVNFLMGNNECYTVIKNNTKASVLKFHENVILDELKSYI